MPDRLERDIEEVLDKIEDFEWHRRKRRPPGRLRVVAERVRKRLASIIAARPARIVPGHLMLAGFLALIVGLVLGTDDSGRWLIYGGAGAFGLGLLWSMRRGQRARPAGGVYWRQRSITYEQKPTGRLRAWWRRRRR